MDATTRTSSTIFPCLCYDDAPAAIEWLCRVYGFEKRLVVPGEDGAVMHSELSLGNGVVMVNTTREAEGRRAPGDLPGLSHVISAYVADPDAHHAHATSEGAEITAELADSDYGARGYSTRDLEGNVWHFSNYQPGAWWRAEE